MTLLRFGFAGVLALTIFSGCETRGPDRASDIQNMNAISDDIAAVSMTQSPTSRAHDPNLPTVFPRNYTTSYTP